MPVPPLDQNAVIAVLDSAVRGVLKNGPPGVSPGVTHFGVADDRTADALSSGSFLVVLVVVDLGEFRVDHVFLLLARRGTIAAWSAGSALRVRLLVHGLAELHGSLRQRVGLGLDEG